MRFVELLEELDVENTPKDELVEKLIKLSHEDLDILGMPFGVRHTDYHRLSYIPKDYNGLVLSGHPVKEDAIAMKLKFIR
jgi:hypothetical protein